MNFWSLRIRIAWALVAGLGLAWGSRAQELKTGNSADAQPRTPVEEQKSFTVPPGFTVELVASEETGLPKPVSVAFDDSGRMWAVTATEYPRDQDTNVWTLPGHDRVVVSMLRRVLVPTRPVPSPKAW